MFNANCYGNENIPSYTQGLEAQWAAHTTHNSQGMFQHPVGSNANAFVGYSLGQVQSKELDLAGVVGMKETASASSASSATNAWHHSHRMRYATTAPSSRGFLPYQMPLTHYDGQTVDTSHLSHSAHHQTFWMPTANHSAYSIMGGSYQRDHNAAYVERADSSRSTAAMRHNTAMPSRSYAVDDQSRSVNASLQQQSAQVLPQHCQRQSRQQIHPIQQHQHQQLHHQQDYIRNQMSQREREQCQFTGSSYHQESMRVTMDSALYHDQHLLPAQHQHQQYQASQEVLRKAGENERRTSFTTRQACFNQTWTKPAYVPFDASQTFLTNHRSTGSAFSPCSKQTDPDPYSMDSIWAKSAVATPASHVSRTASHTTIPPSNNHMSLPAESWLHDTTSHMKSNVYHASQEVKQMTNPASSFSANVLNLDTGQVELSMSMVPPEMPIYPQAMPSQRHRTPTAHHEPPTPQHIPQPFQPPMSHHPPPRPLPLAPTSQNQVKPVEVKEATPVKSVEHAKPTSTARAAGLDVRQFLATWDEDLDLATPRPACVEIDEPEPEEPQPPSIVVLDYQNVPSEEAAGLLHMYPGLQLNSNEPVVLLDNSISAASANGKHNLDFVLSRGLSSSHSAGTSTGYYEKKDATADILVKETPSAINVVQSPASNTMDARASVTSFTPPERTLSAPLSESVRSTSKVESAPQAHTSERAPSVPSTNVPLSHLSLCESVASAEKQPQKSVCQDLITSTNQEEAQMDLIPQSGLHEAATPASQGESDSERSTKSSLRRFRKRKTVSVESDTSDSQCSEIADQVPAKSMRHSDNETHFNSLSCFFGSDSMDGIDGPIRTPISVSSAVFSSSSESPMNTEDKVTVGETHAEKSTEIKPASPKDLESHIAVATSSVITINTNQGHRATKPSMPDISENNSCDSIRHASVHNPLKVINDDCSELNSITSATTSRISSPILSAVSPQEPPIASSLVTTAVTSPKSHIVCPGAHVGSSPVTPVAPSPEPHIIVCPGAHVGASPVTPVLSPEPRTVSFPVTPATPSPKPFSLPSPVTTSAAPSPNSHIVSSPPRSVALSPKPYTVASPGTPYTPVVSPPVTPDVSSPATASALSPKSHIVSSPAISAVSSPVPHAVPSPVRTAALSPKSHIIAPLVTPLASSPKPHMVSSPGTPVASSPKPCFVSSTVTPATAFQKPYIVPSPAPSAVSSPEATGASSPMSHFISSPVTPISPSPKQHIDSSPATPDAPSPTSCSVASPVTTVATSPKPCIVSPSLTPTASSPRPLIVSSPVTQGAPSPKPVIVPSPKQPIETDYVSSTVIPPVTPVVLSPKSNLASSPKTCFVSSPTQPSVAFPNAQDRLEPENVSGSPKSKTEDDPTESETTAPKYLSRIVGSAPGKIPKILLSRLKDVREKTRRRNGVVKKLPSIRLTRVQTQNKSELPEYMCSEKEDSPDGERRQAHLDGDSKTAPDNTATSEYQISDACEETVLRNLSLGAELEKHAESSDQYSNGDFVRNQNESSDDRPIDLTVSDSSFKGVNSLTSGQNGRATVLQISGESFDCKVQSNSTDLKATISETAQKHESLMRGRDAEIISMKILCGRKEMRESGLRDVPGLTDGPKSIEDIVSKCVIYEKNDRALSPKSSQDSDRDISSRSVSLNQMCIKIDRSSRNENSAATVEQTSKLTAALLRSPRKRMTFSPLARANVLAWQAPIINPVKIFSWDLQQSEASRSESSTIDEKAVSHFSHNEVKERDLNAVPSKEAGNVMLERVGEEVTEMEVCAQVSPDKGEDGHELMKQADEYSHKEKSSNDTVSESAVNGSLSDDDSSSFSSSSSDSDNSNDSPSSDVRDEELKTLETVTTSKEDTTLQNTTSDIRKLSILADEKVSASNSRSSSDHSPSTTKEDSTNMSAEKTQSVSTDDESDNSSDKSSVSSSDESSEESSSSSESSESSDEDGDKSDDESTADNEKVETDESAVVPATDGCEISNEQREPAADPEYSESKVRCSETDKISECGNEGTDKNDSDYSDDTESICGFSEKDLSATEVASKPANEDTYVPKSPQDPCREDPCREDLCMIESPHKPSEEDRDMVETITELAVEDADMAEPLYEPAREDCTMAEPIDEHTEGNIDTEKEVCNLDSENEGAAESTSKPAKNDTELVGSDCGYLKEGGRNEGFACGPSKDGLESVSMFEPVNDTTETDSTSAPAAEDTKLTESSHGSVKVYSEIAESAGEPVKDCTNMAESSGPVKEDLPVIESVCDLVKDDTKIGKSHGSVEENMAEVESTLWPAKDDTDEGESTLFEQQKESEEEKQPTCGPAVQESSLECSADPVEPVNNETTLENGDIDFCDLGSDTVIDSIQRSEVWDKDGVKLDSNVTADRTAAMEDNSLISREAANVEVTSSVSFEQSVSPRFEDNSLSQSPENETCAADQNPPTPESGVEMPCLDRASLSHGSVEKTDVHEVEVFVDGTEHFEEGETLVVYTETSPSLDVAENVQIGNESNGSPPSHVNGVDIGVPSPDNDVMLEDNESTSASVESGIANDADETEETEYVELDAVEFEQVCNETIEVYTTDMVQHQTVESYADGTVIEVCEEVAFEETNNEDIVSSEMGEVEYHVVADEEVYFCENGETYKVEMSVAPTSEVDISDNIECDDRAEVCESWTGTEDVVPVPAESVQNWPQEEEILPEEGDGSTAQPDVPLEVKCSLSWDRILDEGQGLVLGPANVEVRVPGSSGRGRSHWKVVTRERRRRRRSIASSTASASSCVEENNNLMPEVKSPIVVVKRLVLKRPRTRRSLRNSKQRSEQECSDAQEVDSWPTDESSLQALPLKTKGALKSYQSQVDTNRRRSYCSRSRNRSWPSTGNETNLIKSTGLKRRKSEISSPVTHDWNSSSPHRLPTVIIKRTGEGPQYESFICEKDHIIMQPVVCLERNVELDNLALNIIKSEEESPAAVNIGSEGETPHASEGERSPERNDCTNNQSDDSEIYKLESENADVVERRQRRKPSKVRRVGQLMKVVELLQQWRQAEQDEASKTSHSDLNFEQDCDVATVENNNSLLCVDNNTDEENQERHLLQPLKYLAAIQDRSPSISPDANVNGVSREASPEGFDESVQPEDTAYSVPVHSVLSNGNQDDLEKEGRTGSPATSEIAENVDSPRQSRRGSTDEESTTLFVCKVCGYSTAFPDEQANHIRTHPYHCQHCQLAFRSQDDFKEHLASEHPSTEEHHHCLLCQRTFPTADRHAQHKKSWQHCLMDRSQRHTIHSLYRLFTGQDCPHLPSLEPHEVDTLDWLPSDPGVIHFYHDATPLQLAVQDCNLTLSQETIEDAEVSP